MALKKHRKGNLQMRSLGNTCIRNLAAFLALALAVSHGESRAQEGLSGTIEFSAQAAGGAGTEVDPRAFGVGEPIVLQVQIANGGNRPWAIERRNLSLPYSFVVRDSSGKVCLSPLKSAYRWYPVEERLIAAGERLTWRVNLLDLYPYMAPLSSKEPNPHRPGVYSVYMALPSPMERHQGSTQPWPPDLWPHMIRSNDLHFTVKECSDREEKNLLSGLDQVPVQEKLQRIKMLSAARAKGAVQALAAIAGGDESCDVRTAALSALSAIGDPAPVEAVEGILRSDACPHVRAEAAALLGRWGLDRSVPVLMDVLKKRTPGAPKDDPEFVWYSAVVRALGDIGDERAIPLLNEVAKDDPADWVRKGAEINIQRIKTGEGKRERAAAAAARAAAEPEARKGPRGWSLPWVAAGVTLGIAATAALVVLRRRRRAAGVPRNSQGDS
jgi:hypothetical protein